MATQKKAAGKAAPAKKAPAKKATPAKKAPAGKKPAAAKKAAPGKKPAAKEIIALMDKMGDEALAMLKRQAEILAYAQEVDAARGKMKEAIDRSQNQKSAKATGAKKPAEVPADTYVDQSGPASFFIGAKGARIFFSREEMRNLTRLSHGAEDALAGARRIFTWMKRERQDFLTDTGISQPGDRSLQRIWEIIVTSYKAS